VQPAYDRPFDLQALYVDPRSGAEHYVIHCTFVLIFDGPFDLELMGPGGDGA
jgi:hypothetical protein